MTKTKARARAKAKVAAKATKSIPKGVTPIPNSGAGYFDKKPGTVGNMDIGMNIKSVAGMRRGGARSR